MIGGHSKQFDIYETFVQPNGDADGRQADVGGVWSTFDGSHGIVNNAMRSTAPSSFHGYIWMDRPGSPRIKNIYARFKMVETTANESFTLAPISFWLRQNSDVNNNDGHGVIVYAEWGISGGVQTANLYLKTKLVGGAIGSPVAITAPDFTTDYVTLRITDDGSTITAKYDEFVGTLSINTTHGIDQSEHPPNGTLGVDWHPSTNSGVASLDFISTISS